MARTFEGVIDLPQSIYVDAEVLGATFVGAVDLGKFSIEFPRLPAEVTAEVFKLQSPYRSSPHISMLAPQYGWGYGAHGAVRGKPRRLDSNVNGIAVKVDSTSDESIGAVGYLFGKLFDAWYLVCAQWVELWTGQELLPRHREGIETSGRLCEFSEPVQQTGWSHTQGITYKVPRSAVSGQMLKTAFANATRNNHAPTEWLLLLRSRRAADLRIAVVEATSAAEVALARALNSRLRDLAESAQYLIAKNTNGIAEMVRLIETIDSVPASASRRNRVADRMAGPRNLAIHRGIQPTREIATAAIDEANALLELYSPLPGP